MAETSLGNETSGYGNWPICLVAVAIVLGSVIGFYWETALSIGRIWWRSDTYAHGFLIIPIVFYLIWLQREKLVYLAPRSQPLGLLVLALLCLLWLLSAIVDVQVIKQFALVAMLPVLVYSLLGTAITWALVFPLTYLFFAVPVGESLVPPLMDFTAVFTVKGLQLTGIPVYWEGRYITIPSGNFEVAEACSGIRYLIASVALGSLYGYLIYRSFWRRLAFFAFAIFVPILANGLRAYGIVMLAHLSDRRLAVGVDHIIYGWMFFGLVILFMFWAGSWWRESDGDVKSHQPIEPKSANSPANKRIGLKFFSVGLAAVVLAASGPLGAAWLANRAADLPVVTLQAPIAPQPWQIENAAVADWTPQYVGASADLRQSYANAGKTASLYIAYYQQQRQGAELINESSNRLYDKKQWRYLRGRTRTIAPTGEVIQGFPLTLNEMEMVAGRSKIILWYWYWVGGYTTTSPVVAKLLDAWDQLSGARKGAAVIAMAAEFNLQESEAYDVLTRFLTDMQTPINDALSQIH